jgi:hypothetical protein
MRGRSTALVPAAHRALPLRRVANGEPQRIDDNTSSIVNTVGRDGGASATEIG